MSASLPDQGPPTIDDFGFEMNRRAPALKTAIGVAAIPYAIGGGVGAGGALLGTGGIGFGTTVTTLGNLGRVAAPLVTGGAALLNQLSRTDANVFQTAFRLGLSAGNTFLRNVDLLTQAVRQVRPDAQLNYLGNIGNSQILGSTVSGVGIAEVNGVTVVVKVIQGTPQIIGQLP